MNKDSKRLATPSVRRGKIADQDLKDLLDHLGRLLAKEYIELLAKSERSPR
jgi:hypothetical protein